MIKKPIIFIIIVILLLFPWFSARLSGQPPAIFSDDFEGTLSKWVGKDGGTHTGTIVQDPLDPSNHVVTFAGLTASGDIFSSEISVDPEHFYVLEFDYLGLPIEGTPEDNTGGTIGIADDTPGGGGAWLAGTINANNIRVELIDDGNWHSYSISIAPYEDFTVTNGDIRIMVEDWYGQPPDYPTGVIGDVFFDNITLYMGGSPIPTLSHYGMIAVVLLLLAAGTVFIVRRRRAEA